MKLQGKNAVVTGGGTGIGLGIAVALAAEGCRVAIAGRRADVLLEAAAKHARSAPMLCHSVDVADRASVEQLFQWATRELGHVDILVNSAGTNVVHRALADTTPEDWQMLLDINLSGTFHCMQAVLPQMRSRGDGLIINVSSIAGKRALRLAGVAYCASKFAATALGTFATLEEGRNGIRVTNIYPGEVDTPILERRPVPLTAEQRGRILQPEDVGAAAVMIACLPPRAHVAEIVIKPTTQEYA
ncbi:MAG TPA: SDR family oxidoreductase [Pirellulales bacterium]|jgi:NAD(P)-dependent dehydrogenase (short-subunit alcohol dehydrogenase family)|nr:SDR family oxidoreductase [Pirellulales bacterium]